MARANRDIPKPSANPTYWEQTRWPLQSLLFLLPLLVIYELGAWWLAPAHGTRLPPIFAERLMSDFFHVLGVSGYYLPGILVTVVLLVWHVVRRDPWKTAPKTLGLMWVESVFLAIPLIILMATIFRQPINPPDAEQLAMLAASPNSDALASISSWPEGVVFSIGAGIYEELLFRLIAISLIHMVLSDLLALPEPASSLSAVILSAVLFAVYHFDVMNPLDWTAHDWYRFGFYMFAGLYFSGVFVLRGFGIVAGTHAMYDIIVVTQHFITHEPSA
ncbi:CPBP family intramembrane glutamic endopeptidase [Mucisphaera calidilacus]|uniref:CAAX amino terminal protease self-immunity n=1 Tax=Mucisphaera calidilacus TaxID=2527982 RepID=A0A518C0Y8_9BACT|nr:CPBP family intramembrane glutamic endopeptidase [Mucisphaera calidilacus]QDU72897.1 CAAX amino terminal protease self- immunity [Mucisphaera calidilacus]